MSKRSNALFLALFIGMASVGAALIWSVPPLFSPHEPYRVWMTGILGSLFLVLTVGTLYLRPTKRRPSEPNADE